MIYDYVTTMEDEARIVWKGRFAVVPCLLLSVRWNMVLIGFFAFWNGPSQVSPMKLFSSASHLTSLILRCTTISTIKIHPYLTVL